MSFTTELLVIITTLGLALIAYYKWAHTHWKRKHIPQIPPSIPFGNAESPLNTKIGFQFMVKDFYDEFKSKGFKHGGFYLMATPVYFPVDPEYIKNIMLKDFQHFVDRGVYYNEKNDPLSAHLFNIEGQKWKQLRAKVSPTFTSGKMKIMFQTLVDVGQQLRKHIDKLESRNQIVDIKELVACFTTDIIGSCAFGIECNSFNDPDAEFRRYGRKIFTLDAGRRTKLIFAMSFPKLSRFLGVSITPKDISTFFLNAMKNIITHRENSKVNRNDFIQLILELKNKNRANQQDLGALTFKEMAAQSYVFFIAGFETSSTTMTFCMFELAKNQLVQQKLREEINSVVEKYDGKLTYEGVMEMKYMGQVLDETLRKYPPLLSLLRVCTKDYQVPGTDVVLEKGARVMISTYALHHDPEYFPDPESFDPDRFTEENKAKRNPFVYLPFGEGPRNCIGLRFGLMQAKIGLASMLPNYRFTLNKNTPDVLRFNPRSGLLSTEEDVLLNVQKLP